MRFLFSWELKMIEIERKFLVNSDAFKTEAFNSYIIKQGFLNSHKKRTTRVRLIKDKGYITIKGKSSEGGLSRFEWEKEISRIEGEALLELCDKGLIIAEVELISEDESFQKPNWLGDEVTGDIKYYNSQLSKRPFKTW